IAVLTVEALLFFAEVSPVDFFTGTRWSASIKPFAFGVIPLGPQTVGIEIGPNENGAYRVRDDGSGLLVQVWDHLITLEPEEDGTRYTDRVRIEAGLMTPFVWAFAMVFYRWRQARWRSLVKRQFRY
ncbi:MAG: hypothetical protein ACK528_14595, partial [Alphaproteobacteria bacterium]